MIPTNGFVLFIPILRQERFGGQLFFFFVLPQFEISMKNLLKFKTKLQRYHAKTLIPKNNSIKILANHPRIHREAAQNPDT